MQYSLFTKPKCTNPRFTKLRFTKPRFANLSLILLVLLFAGCAGLEKHIQTPTVHYAGSEIKDTSLYEATIDFLIRVDNPNPISLPINGLSYTVDVNGKKILSGSAQPGKQVPAKASLDLAVPVTVRYEEILDSLQELMHKDTFEYAVKGDIDMGFFKLPYDASGTIPLPDLPKIQLKAINVNKLTFEGVETAMQLNIKNSNDFPLNASGLSYQLLLNQITTLSGQTTEAIAIPANSERTVEIKTLFSLAELGRALDTFRQSNSVSATLKGQIDVPISDNQIKSIPFSWSGETPLSR